MLYIRLVSVGILERETESRDGKLGWHGNFDIGFERSISFKPKHLETKASNIFWSTKDVSELCKSDNQIKSTKNRFN